jgi:hypothetical protein
MILIEVGIVKNATDLTTRLGAYDPSVFIKTLIQMLRLVFCVPSRKLSNSRITGCGSVNDAL